MNQANTLKEKFKHWLINSKGLKEKTIAGKPSTVSFYIAKIDKVCDAYFGTHNQDDWIKLEKIIDDVLYRYTLCDNRTYYIYGKKSIEIISFLNEIANFWEREKKDKDITNNQYPKIKFKYTYNNKDYYINEGDEKPFNQLSEDYAEKFTDIGGAVGPLFILKQTSGFKDKETYISVLLKFSEFIEAKKATSSIVVVKEKKPREYKNKYCEALKRRIYEYENRYTLYNNINKETVKNAREVLKNMLTKLDAKFGLSIDDVVFILNCHRRTLDRLIEKGLLLYDRSLQQGDRNRYNEFDVIDFLEKSFHQRIGGKKFADYTIDELSKFMNSESAAEEIGCTSRAITKNYTKRFNYIKILERILRFCPHDVKDCKKT